MAEALDPLRKGGLLLTGSTRLTSAKGTHPAVSLAGTAPDGGLLPARADVDVRSK